VCDKSPRANREQKHTRRFHVLFPPSLIPLLLRQTAGDHETWITKMLLTVSNNGSEGVLKTSLMYKSFLSYAQLKEYLPFLVEITR
jgi:hypothetical protein